MGADPQEPANDGDERPGQDEDQCACGQAEGDAAERNPLPGRWGDRAEDCHHRREEHPLLLGHRAAEFVGRARALAHGADVRGHHGGQRRAEAQQGVAAGRVAQPDQRRRIGNAVGHLVEQLAHLRCRLPLDRDHAVEHVRQQPALDADRSRDPEEPGELWETGREEESDARHHPEDHARDRDPVRRESPPGHPGGHRPAELQLARGDGTAVGRRLAHRQAA